MIMNGLYVDYDPLVKNVWNAKNLSFTQNAQTLFWHTMTRMFSIFSLSDCLPDNAW